MHSRNSPLRLATVESAVRAALEVAERNGVGVCVAIVDDRGHDVMVVRDRAIWFTAGAARAKAATSALLGMPTSSFAELANEYPDLLPLIQSQVRESITTLPGGVPLTVGGEVVGGIGVSGATPDQDAEYAQVGAEHFVRAQRSDTPVSG
ncbi:heme-binding protein [Rhodococcus sp. PSBB049]|uniref:heme-binding protein n=1 Tax=Rhodococcus sp. PSBB049 TaxID=2812863 RepID=UPI0019802747|nr:heme-binding protein [Rhodococcus sp. PSBB049]QSE72450.1 heme-binding protein [Rhodococcus sp. PSBB049]